METIKRVLFYIFAGICIVTATYIFFCLVLPLLVTILVLFGLILFLGGL